MTEIAKPKGKISDDTLQYCAEVCGSTIEPVIVDSKLVKTVKLGYFEFSGDMNRKVVENVFRFVSQLPNPNVEVQS